MEPRPDSEATLGKEPERARGGSEIVEFRAMSGRERGKQKKSRVGAGGCSVHTDAAHVTPRKKSVARDVIENPDSFQLNG